MSVRNVIAPWVRAKRTARGWTQYTLGRTSGLGRGAIAQYEQGRRAPGRVNMGRLLDAFGVKDKERQRAMRWAERNLKWK